MAHRTNPEYCTHSFTNSKVTNSRIVDGQRVRQRLCGLCGSRFAAREVADFRAQLLLTKANREHANLMNAQHGERIRAMKLNYEATKRKPRRTEKQA